MKHDSVDIAKCKDYLRQKEEATRQKNRELYLKAADDAERIIEMIRAKYAPERIWQWGSLLEQENFRDYSDIDIALEGITDAETFFKLMGEAMDMTNFSLDIVQMEKIEPEFSELIRMKGKIVYGKRESGDS